MTGAPWRRLLQFGVLQLVAAISPVLVLPVVVAQVGEHGWVGLSIGYGIGAAAAIMVALAWPVVGPSLVAIESPNVRAAYYLESVRTRTYCFVATSTVASVAAAMLAPDGARGLAVAMAIAMASWGLTPSWYFVGVGNPRGILNFETLPRLAASLMAIPFVHFTGVAYFYPTLVLLGSLLPVTLAHRMLVPRGQATVAPPGASDRLRTNVALALSSVVGAGYTSLAVPLASASGLQVGAVSSLASAFRIKTLGQFGTNSVTTALQGWVPDDDDGRAARKRVTASVLVVICGAISAVALAVVAPWIAEVLFGDVAPVDRQLAMALAAGALPVALSATLAFHWLVPLGQVREVAAARIAGTVIGVPLIVLAARTSGASAVMWAMNAAEVVVCLWCLNALKRRYNS
ncbi:hypothetical protein NMQ01_03920 [Janibacter sp. CX7]|uniref:hypothetical protein n=1 Tax=Janibacter sp. CX7 TaxID=2963431 RepID=UPI0020CFE69F|nr:hypothetical protein [Janibacter sp. CX7]UTT66875.1 hypothetical protein NMQ01_03920 [Janibacter sp. CX7]